MPAGGRRVQPSLAGFRIGVTSDRRAGDMIAAFERRGAQVVHAPAMHMLPLAQDAELIVDTQRIIDSAPDAVLVTTAYGMRRWAESADAAGIGEQLIDTLEASRILVRGPKARGAVRANGLDDDFIADSEVTSQLVDHLIETGVSGRTVAVQLHGSTDHEQLDRLRRAGARVLTVTPYRWSAPDDSGRLPQLIAAVCEGRMDAVTFTSAPAADALLSVAHQLGRRAELIAALRGPVVAAAVGEVTAGLLRAEGIAPIVPERSRMGALIRLVGEYLEGPGVLRADTPHGAIEIRGTRVTVGGTLDVELAPGPLAVLRELVRQPAAVVSRDALAHVIPGGSERALDMTVSRLRAQLPEPGLVATVVKRGYRLNAAPR